MIGMSTGGKSGQLQTLLVPATSDEMEQCEEPRLFRVGVLAGYRIYLVPGRKEEQDIKMRTYKVLATQQIT